MNIYERINVLLKTSAYIAFDKLYADPLHTHIQKKIHSTEKRKKGENSLYSECLKRENQATVQFMKKFLLRKIFRLKLCVLYIGNFQFICHHLFYYRK